MKTIEGVPDHLTREQYLSLLEAVGFTPDRLMSLEFHFEGIYAVVFEVDPAGSRILLERGNHAGGYAKHRVFVPVWDGGQCDHALDGRTVHDKQAPYTCTSCGTQLPINSTEEGQTRD